MELKIPLGWSIKQIKDIGKCVTGTTPKTNEPEYYSSSDYDFLSPADLGNSKYIYNSNKKVSKKGIEVSRSIPKNTVLCVCIGSSIGKVGLSWHEKSCTNQQINSIICNNFFDSQFIYYLLLYYSDYWKSSATFSTVPILNKGRFEEIIIPICDDIEEQRKIAAVLSLVQNAIAQQEQLITLTTELKTALMQQLFTKGTCDEPQKITEIGLIPESWEILPLEKLCLKIVDCPHSTPDFKPTGIRCIKNVNLRNGFFVDEPAFYTSEEDYKERIKRGEPQENDVLFSREAPVGESCLVPQGLRMSLGQRMMLLRTDQKLLNSYFLGQLFYSPSVKLRMKSLEKGATAKHLNLADVKSLKISKPPKQEQIEISNLLNLLDIKLINHKNKKQQLKDLFRTLLHQLMTAQIRVDDLNLSALNLKTLNPEFQPKDQSQANTFNKDSSTVEAKTLSRQSSIPNQDSSTVEAKTLSRQSSNLNQDSSTVKSEQLTLELFPTI